jgi:predicted dehydrogenase
MRDAHAPALRELAQQYEIVAIYSRTAEAAKALAATFANAPAVYTDLDALLHREDVEVVDIALPIEVMPDAIRRAFAAGKHVISEKPAAPTLAEAQALLGEQPDGVRWLVAENWRYEAAFQQASALIAAGEIGTVRYADWNSSIRMVEDNPYYHSQWRRQPAFQGGFLFDVGVHYMGALRHIFGEIVRVTAFTSAQRPDLPPLDTMSAVLEFASGLLVNFGVTFAAEATLPSSLNILGSTGALRVDRSHIEIVRGGETERRQMWDVYPRSTLAMFNDYAAYLRGDTTTVLGTAQNGIADVAAMEAIFRSAASGRAEIV